MAVERRASEVNYGADDDDDDDDEDFADDDDNIEGVDHKWGR